MARITHPYFARLILVLYKKILTQMYYGNKK